MSVNPDGSGDFYALHIRRGDLQFKVDPCLLVFGSHLFTCSCYSLSGGENRCGRNGQKLALQKWNSNYSARIAGQQNLLWIIESILF